MMMRLMVLIVVVTVQILAGRADAASSHLWWNIKGCEDATCVYGEITVLATHDPIYYCGANWHPGEPAGGYVRDVTPSPDAVTVRERHSFIALPEPGFVPREFDPRAGYFDFSWFDYSAPFPQPLTKRFITRHRLEKKDPSAAVSEPVTPVIETK